jgi:hypothetical protein
LCLGEAQKQLEKEAHGNQNKSGESPSQGNDCCLPLLVGEVQPGEFAAKLFVDPFLFEILEAKKSVASEKAPAEKRKCVCENAYQDAMSLNPVHGWMVDDLQG